MLNSGEQKIRTVRDKKKIRTLLLSEKKNSERTKKNHTPPFLPVKWSFPNIQN